MMNETRIGSYPSVYAIGHKAIIDIFRDPVLIEEKIDGSQFSMMMDDAGELHCRSKGKQIVIDEPEKMFSKAIKTAKKLAGKMLHPGWVYRCEYLQKPKHNTLCYERIPEKNLILFDVMTGPESYLSRRDKVCEAETIGLEVVPMIYQGKVDSLDMFKEFLERESILGGTKVEGVVVKNYSLFTQEKKVAIGKYVSEAFKEKHGKEWKKSNPGTKDILGDLITIYRHKNRWEKAIQHLRDAGELEESPRDIGALIREVPADVLKECEDEIKDKLFAHFWPKIRRGITAGLPEWYKEQLAAQAFEISEADSEKAEED